MDFVKDSRFLNYRDPPPTYSTPNISWVFKSMRGSRGGQGSGPPEILTILTANKLLNGISLAGRCWPAFSGIWILSPLKKYCQCCRVGPPLTKLSGSAHEKNQYIDNPIQHSTRREEKCVYYSYALNVLLNVFFFASKAPKYEGSNLCAD